MERSEFEIKERESGGGQMAERMRKEWRKEGEVTHYCTQSCSLEVAMLKAWQNPHIHA